MTSIDELFRKPSTTTPPTTLPTGHKRKFPQPANPSSSINNTHKSAKRTVNGTPHTATVEDEAGRDAEADDDIAAGPLLPPSDAEEEEEEEDEDGGRFFGGGVSADTREALNYVEAGAGEGGQEEEEVIDVAWLRRMAVQFERGINRNAELRGRFEGEPEK